MTEYTPEEIEKQRLAYYDDEDYTRLFRIGNRITIRPVLIWPTFAAVPLAVIGGIVTKMHPMAALIAFGIVWSLIALGVGVGQTIGMWESRKMMLARLMDYLYAQKPDADELALIKSTAADGMTMGGLRTAMPLLIVPGILSVFSLAKTMDSLVSLSLGAIAVMIALYFLFEILQAHTNAMIKQAVERYEIKDKRLKRMIERA